MWKKRRIAEAIRIAMLIAGLAISSLSMVSTFGVSIPFIRDWRVGLVVGLAMFFISTLLYILELQGKYLWSEPEIILSPRRDSDYIYGRSVDVARLTVYNDEETEITNCYATLELATNLYGGDMTPVNIVKKDRLRWVEEKYTTDDCKISIAPKSEVQISVANNLNNFHFTFCKPSAPLGQDITGIYIIRIRIDGKWRGNDIKPQFFDGYLYVNNYLGESGELTATTTDEHGTVTKTVTPSHPEIYTRMIFEKGDWMKDKRIPRPNQE